MKNIIKTLSFFLLLICLIVTGYAQQKVSYYSNNKKIELTLDTNIIVLKSKTVNLKELRENQFQNLEILEENKNNVLRISTTKEYKYSRKSIISTIRNNKDSYCWYELKNGESIIIPTGEVIFKPKKDISYITLLYKLKLTEKVSFKSINKHNYVLVNVKDVNEIFNVANAIYESGLVEWSHPNFWIPIEKNTDDAFFNQQYYIKNTGQTGGTNGIDINVEVAWCITKGANIKVAVIDDGVEAHEELTGRVLSGFTPRSSTGFGAPVNTPIPSKHGQACAGIIGATQNNTIGISGVAPECQIIPINVKYDGFETTYDFADAIDWAWEFGQADIISCSLGIPGLVGDGFDAVIASVFKARTLGRSGKGCPVVFASGNALPYSGVSFPASINDVIAVGAIDKSGNIWDYSCRGVQMDLVAPTGNIASRGGGDVTTTDRMGNNGYNSTNYMSNFGGTSAACPQVAGVCALMLAANPNLTEVQLRTKLQQTATDMGATGFDNTYGYGRVNAFKALTNDITLSGANSICPTNGSVTYTLSGVPVGATVTWSASPANTVTLTPTGVSCLVTRTGAANNLVILTANVVICGNPIPKTKSINVGSPYTLWSSSGCIYPEAQIELGVESGPCNSQCYSTSISKWWCAAPVYNATSVTWQKVSSIPADYNFWSGSWIGNNNFVNILFKAANQYVELKTTITNACNTASPLIQYYCFNSTSTLCNGSNLTSTTSNNCKSYDVSINPTSKQVQIKKNNNNCDIVESMQIKSIQIVDKIGNVVKQQNYQSFAKSNVYEFNLSETKNDIYFVLIQYDDDFVESHQIAIFK